MKENQMKESPESQFSKHLQRLLLELEKEKEAEKEEFKQEWLTLSIGERKRKGLTIHPISLKDYSSAVGGNTKATFSFQRCVHMLHPGQMVRIFREDMAVEGVLSRVGRDDLDIILEEIPDWAEEGKPGIDMVFQETTYREMQTGIKRAEERSHPNRYYNRRILAGFIDETPRLPSCENIDDISVDANMNESQKKAILGLLCTEDVALIHGPPGTGKTTVLVESVRLMLQKGERILLCAPTNAAADLLAEKLLEKNIPVLRAGHPARISDALQTVTMEGRLENHPEAKLLRKYRKEANDALKSAKKYRRQFGAKEKAERQSAWQEFRSIRQSIRQLEDGLLKQILSNSNVIVTTLVGAASRRLEKNTFTVAIIDEATQALEGAAWIPLCKADRLILAGDHRQLSPVVKSDSEFLKTTLFERSIEFHQKNQTGRLFFLDTQYRMEEEIMSFSNKEFYENRLKTHHSVLEREPLIPEPFSSRLVFIDTAGSDCEEEEDEATESLRNEGEAKLILHLLEGMRPFLSEQKWSVGLIATYRAQAEFLQDLLERSESLKEQDLEASTVDAFQGSEKDAIIISLVRSNDEGEIGFLSDLRRMNVALTRARRLLIVTGNSATLARHPFYDRFIQFVEKTGELRSIWDSDLAVYD